MAQQFSISALILARPVVKALTALASAWHAVASYQATKYRPEKHYMRGPRPVAVH
jgi:hypothetical protein